MSIGIFNGIKMRMQKVAASGGLLLDTYSNSVAAYSIRKLRSEYSGACMLVRRDSDNTEHTIGFENGYADTALIQELGTSDVNTYTSDFSADSDGFSTDDVAFTAGVTKDGFEDCLEVELTNGNQVHQMLLPLAQTVGEETIVSFDSWIEVGADIGAIRITGNDLPPVQTQGEWVSHVLEPFVPASTTLQMRILSASLGNFINDDGSKLWLRNVKVTRTDSDISVVRWFNQATNGGYVEQNNAALQPLVAKSGVLVLSDSKLALEYNTTDTSMIMSTSVPLPDSFYNVFVADIGKTSANTSCTMTGDIASASRLSLFDITWRHKIEGVNANISTSNLRDGKSILSSNRDGFDRITAYLNSIEQGSVSAGGGITYSTVGPDVAANSLDGTLQEFIIFDNDNGAIHSDIETSINDYYGVY